MLKHCCWRWGLYPVCILTRLPRSHPLTLTGNSIHGKAESDGDDGGGAGGGVLLGRLQGGVEWQRPLSSG